MKKIIGLMLLLVSALALTFSNSIHAVLVEKTVDFNIISIESTSQELRKVINVGENMYQKLSAYTKWNQSFNNQNNPHPLTIKKGSLSYEGRITHRFHNTWNVYIYTVGIKLDDTWSSFEFYPDDFVIPFSQSIHVPLNYGQFSTANRNLNFSLIPGQYTIHGLFESVISDEDGIPVDHISEVPLTSGTLADASELSKVGYVYFNHDSNDLYNTSIMLNGKQYNLGKIKLPGVTELNREPISPGIYYSENGIQYLYYEFIDASSNIPINEQALSFIDDIDNVKGFRPFVSMNLTEETYVFTDKLKLYAAYQDGVNGRAFVDVLFPMQLDDLLAIEMEYQFRWQVLFGLSYTPWETKKVARVKDEVVDMASTWQHVTNWLTLNPVTAIYDVVSTVSGWTSGNTIAPVLDLNQAYKNRYLETINNAQTSRGNETVTMNQLFTNDVSMYRVYLDTLSDIRYTGYQIHEDIAIMYVTYQYKGEIYHVDYEAIDAVTGGGSSDVFKDLEKILLMFNDFQAFINSIDWNNAFYIGIAVVVVFIILMLLNPVILLVKLIFSTIKLVYKSVFNLIKFLVKLPGYIFKFIKLLIVPGKKKKNNYKRSYK